MSSVYSLPSGRVVDPGVEDLEVDLLLEGVYQHYGYDFRGYARGSIKRRLWRRAAAENVATISALQERILHEPAVMESLLGDLSVTVTAMFRDPTFHRALRERVVPLLRTYPFVRIWNAGCSTGEETFSLAILLHEMGLADRARIYATDINDAVLRQARAGEFPLEKMQEYTRNYISSGGTVAFSDYYSVVGDRARFRPDLVSNVVFAQHNLASDSAFNEFNLILCRNVMIYFKPELQHRVHDLFYDSLVKLGLLALGHKETIRFTRHASSYEELDPVEKIYRKAT